MTTLTILNFILLGSFLQQSWTVPLTTISTYRNLQLLVDTTGRILLQEFQDQFGVLHLTEASTSSEATYFHPDFVNNVIRQLDGRVVVRINVVRNETLRRPRTRNLLLVDSYKAFVAMSQKLSPELYDSYGKYLLVYTGEMMNDWIARKIFRDLWKLQIINLVLIATGKNDVEMWTYFPFSERGCRLIGLKKLSDEDELYPEKTATFYGCSFRVGSFDNKPFTILKPFAGVLSIGGFEGDLLNLLMQKLNFKTIVYVPPDSEQWGYARPTNSTGLMRMIQMEEVDFGISALGISVARSEVLKAGLAHHTSSIVVAVPDGRPYTPFEKLFRPFQASIWAAIIGTFIIALCAIMVIETKKRSIREFVYGRGINTPYLNLTQIFFGIGMSLLPRRNFARTMLFLWLYLCFILRSLYQGAMFQYLQSKSNLSPSRTLVEIDQTDAYYYMVLSAERYFEAFPHRYQRVRHLDAGPNNIINRLEWMYRNPESRDVLMASIDHMANFHRSTGQTVNVCRETIATFSTTIYYPKKSMLTKQFDRQLLRIQAAGVVNYWIRLYGDYNFYGVPIAKAEPRQLDNEHLMMAYQMLGILLGISCVVFVLELASVKIRQLRLVLEKMSGVER